MAHDRLDGTVDDAQHRGLLEWEQVRADCREQRDGVEAHFCRRQRGGGEPAPNLGLVAPRQLAQLSHHNLRLRATCVVTTCRGRARGQRSRGTAPPTMPAANRSFRRRLSAGSRLALGWLSAGSRLALGIHLGYTDRAGRQLLVEEVEDVPLQRRQLGRRPRLDLLGWAASGDGSVELGEQVGREGAVDGAELRERAQHRVHPLVGRGRRVQEAAARLTRSAMRCLGSV